MYVYLSGCMPARECVCACLCVCNGLVGVALGDGQPPIGRDLKRHALFFSVNKDKALMSN